MLIFGRRIKEPQMVGENCAEKKTSGAHDVHFKL